MTRSISELLAAPPRAATVPTAILARAAALADTTTDPAVASDPAAAIETLRGAISWCLGLDRVPRVATSWRAVRELAGDGYTVEVGSLTAVADLPVPAHIWRPTGSGRHPAVVHVPGHWMENARLEPDVQRFNARLARAGILVLCYDPIGQGERRRGWHTHGQLAPLLVGFTSLGVMVAETRGALDLLTGRSDVDATRLAVTGASGGGFVATFTAAIDRRVKAACICCILNTHLSQLRDAAFGTGWDGWADLCNQVPRLAATANMGVVLGAATPRAVTVVHAVDDAPFPIAGARSVVSEAARVYTAAGANTPPRLVEVVGGHGLHAAMRDQATAALTRALGLGEPAPEAPLALLARAWPVTHDVARAATPQTRTRTPTRLPGEALDRDVDTNPVLVALAQRVATQLRAGRSPDRDAIARLLGGPPQPAAAGRVTNHVALADGGYAQRIELAVTATVTLDAVLWLPASWADDAPGVLVTVDEGGKATALNGLAATTAHDHGWAVFAPDLRGTGESAASEFEVATAAWMLDRDLLADRVSDLSSCVTLLSERYSTGQQIDKRRIVVHGGEAFGLVALVCAALDDSVAGGCATGFVESLEDLLVESPRITPMVYAFRALETFDIPDLARIAAPRPLLAAAPDQDPRRVVTDLLTLIGS